MFKFFSVRSRVYAGQTLGDGEGQRSLACCRTWDCKESYMTARLNNNEKYEIFRGPENLNCAKNAIRINTNC